LQSVQYPHNLSVPAGSGKASACPRASPPQGLLAAENIA
jgi:hypothetical protein